MYSFEVMKGGNFAMTEILYFLGAQGCSPNDCSPNDISEKMVSFRKNTNEDVFLVARNKFLDIVGLCELTVEYKFTRGLCKLYHIEKIICAATLSQTEAKDLRRQMVEFMITHAKKEGFYKVLLAETDKDLMVEDEKAGYQRNQTYMQTASQPVKSGPKF